MDASEALDQFDLGTHGDRHEQQFWPLLSTRFPSYELLWRALIVPLTNRVDPTASLDSWIRFRANIPEQYQQMSMASYSVFYFLGRAAERLSEEGGQDVEYPEDILFLLDSAGDNFKRFMQTMNGLGKDCGVTVFDAPMGQFPRGFDPFKEISDYRDTFLHNTVMGKGVIAGKTYIPKWNPDKAASPLERAKSSWRAAGELSTDERISSVELLDRLISECCATLDRFWQTAMRAVSSERFQRKMLEVTNASDYIPFGGIASISGVQPASGCFSSLGSNTTFAPPAVRSDAQIPSMRVRSGQES